MDKTRPYAKILPVLAVGIVRRDRIRDVDVHRIPSNQCGHRPGIDRDVRIQRVIETPDKK